ncbi:MAG: phenylalanine--tRNA ligase subunit beta, partial [Longicatena sp.]
TGAVLKREVEIPAVEGIAAQGSATKLKIHSESEKCPLFLGKVINEVSIKPSPKWMKELLMAAGMKSINNVVDISNIVMLETGQPLHFYDIDAIKDQEITVKDHIHEDYTALDGVTYALNDEDIVITNAGKPIGIAGVMGGNDSKIEETTKGIIIEAAIFHHVSIRNTARRLNLNTDASVRYQKGIEPMATFKAMDRAVELLIAYADAKGLEETVQFGSNHYTPVTIDVNVARMNTLLGTDFAESEVMQVLQDLHLNPTKLGEDIHVEIPSYRTDLLIEPDIAEEIIRILGYDRLPCTMPQTTSTLGHLNKRQKLRRKLRSTLSDLGYNEAVTYTLVSKKKIDEAVMGDEQVYELASPMSEDRRYIRNSILPGLLDSIAYNQARSVKDIALFEISNAYGIGNVEERLCVAASGALHKNRWQNYSVDVDFYTLKGVLESILSSIGFDEKRVVFKENHIDCKNFHPYRSAEVYLGKELLGFVGQLHPMLAKTYDINDTIAMEINLEILLKNKASKVKFSEVSKFPSVTRDLAFVVKEDVKVANIINSIKKNGKLGKENIIQNVEVFDVYTGEHVEKGNKSIALSITFQSFEKTLKDTEINSIHELILETLKKDVQAELRS